MSTKGYGGRTISKTARVITSDPNNSEIRLRVSARVEEFAVIKPRRLHLAGTAGEEISDTVTIIPATEEPFRILKVSTLKGTEIRHELRQVEISGKRAYKVRVTNEKQTPGRYYDRLVIITDVTNHEPLSVVVLGTIREKGQEQSE